MSTSYKLVSSYLDRKDAETFLNDAGVEFKDLKFPSVVARRGREVIGVIGTVPSDKAVIAGPIHVGVSGNKAFVFKNLVTAYEKVLQLTGVKMYNFSVPEDDEDYLSILDKLPDIFKRFTNGGDREGVVWFKRQL